MIVPCYRYVQRYHLVLFGVVWIGITPRSYIFQAKYRVEYILSLCRISFCEFMQRFMGLIPSLQVSNLVNSGNFLI